MNKDDYADEEQEREGRGRVEKGKMAIARSGSVDEKRKEDE